MNEISAISEKLEIEFWLRGGWAIDFLLGKITRPHVLGKGGMLLPKFYMMSGNLFYIEVERENRSLSIIILSSNTINSWTTIYNSLLVNLINDSGAWTNKSLTYLENLGVVVLKAKHSTKEIQNRAEGLLTKLL